jgi:hypothetical protein
MRALFALLALLGIAGIVLGVLTILRGMQGQPFSFENYGGPGPIIAGIIILAATAYLRSIWKPKD